MRNFAKLVLIGLLRTYKWAVSPLLPPACRYVPTCSEYAMEAVERYGVLRGGVMAFARLLRCHPFAQSGYDPVLKNRGFDLAGERPTTNPQRPMNSAPHHSALRGNC